MLALATGWTPRVMASLPGPFSAACRWALYVKAIAGDGLHEPERPPIGSSFDSRRVYGEQVSDFVRVRDLLFPEGD